MAAPRKTEAEAPGTAPDDTRAKILAVAAEVFAKKGYTHTTVREVGRAAGLQSGSVYHRFPSKEAILVEILEAALDELHAGYAEVHAAEIDPESALRQLLTIGMRFVAENRDAVTLMQEELGYLRHVESAQSLDDKYTQIRDIWIDVLARGESDGVLRGDIKPGIVYRAMMGNVLSMARWFDPAGPVGIDELIASYTKLYLGGITAPNRERADAG